MSELAQTKSVADFYLDEIDANKEIRLAYNSIIISHSASIFQALSGDKSAQGNLSAALKYKTVDPGAFYKPLIVQINGVFENYIR